MSKPYRPQVPPKRDYYASLGAAQERAAVVAWLRACALDPETTGAEMRLLLDHAIRIERGEHRREETK